MKLEKAIEILELDSAECEFLKRMDLKEAEQLGIEALKRLHVLRLISTNEANHLLPDETEK